MELEFCKPNKTLNNNEIKRIKYNIIYVPVFTILSYFFWNYENIYFLILALFQLSTLWFIPKEMSPTGPFSTAIPLLICVTIEIIMNIAIWYKDWRLESLENNTQYTCLDIKNKKIIFNKINNRDIYPGHVIRLEKEAICPVDGIVIDSSCDEKYSKTSLALLTGESNVHHITKPNKYFKINDYLDAKLLINNYYPNNFHNLDGKIIQKKNHHEYKIQGENFIVAGSIIKSKDVFVWVTACGKDKKSYFQTQKVVRNKNRIDISVGKYMMNVNAVILLLLITICTLTKFSYMTKFSIYDLILIIVQNWILFNGIIPFSVKIFLTLSRTLQSSINNKNNTDVKINTSQQIDDVAKIDKILSDKTGTITKNELEFSKLLEIWKNKIIDVEPCEYAEQCEHLISLDFHKCLGLCIHHDKENYSTVEDKVIRSRYLQLNNKINQLGDKITLTINETEYKYEYIEIGGLDFTFERRLSSKIVKTDNEKYYVYCKGALDIIKPKVKIEYSDELKRLDTLISKQHPDLRLLACAYKEISYHDIHKLLQNDNFNQTELIKNLEYNLELLGIIGIKDNLQSDVKLTVDKCKQYGIHCCLLTGDRKITAIAIAKEAGIIDNYQSIEYITDHDTMINDIDNKTLIFGGATLDLIIKDNRLTSQFNQYLCTCKNFVGYNLIPEHKKILADILENKGIKTLTVGDGFNDVGMFNVSSVNVAIKGNDYVEANADFVIKEFKHLSSLFDISIESYYKNSKIVNFTFYRCSCVIFSLMTYYLLNYDKTSLSLFNGFILQAFNFAWTLPIIAYVIFHKNNKMAYKNSDFNISKTVFLTSYENVTRWNISGIITGILLVLINSYWFKNYDIFSDLTALILIIILNIRYVSTLSGALNKLKGILFAFLGILNFIIYMIFVGSAYDVLLSIFMIGKWYWMFICVAYFLTNVILIKNNGGQ